MTYWLSQPFEALIARLQRDTGELEHPEGTENRPFATVIIGSGYGAAMAALALTEGCNAEEGASIHVLERGREYVPGEFPKTIGDLPGYVSVLSDQPLFHQAPRTGNSDALWQIRMGDGVSAVVGSGLGGTSLINANVVLEPDPAVFNDWPEPTIHTPHADKSWQANLHSSFEYVKKLLGANEHPQARQLKKFTALERTATTLNLHCKPAPIAVSFRSGRNAVGVEQKQCTDCGNCVSGCNIGAKNTLAVNAWPLARSRGVNLHTGVEVRRLRFISRLANDERSPMWAIECRSTRPSGAMVTLYARRVILAAGTFGSTEILRRSQYASKPLRASRLLGQRFSTNGDVLAFSYGQNAPVQAAAHSPSLRGEDSLQTARVGPTIVGCARPHENHGRSGTNPGQQFGTLEDGAVPYPIVRIWGEILSTQNLLRRYGRCGIDQWTQQHPQQDPLAVSRDALDHHQVMLAMGDDGARGWLSLAEPEGALLPSWPSSDRVSKAQRYFRRVDQALQKSEVDDGFDGGHYLANAAWRAFPPEMQGVAEGAQAAEHLLTVHPLGGCSMGDSAESGVVNTRGQVFCDHQGTGVYPGLYVLDGSIVPGALGTNPLLTIAGLAHHLATAIRNHGRVDAHPALTAKNSSLGEVDAAWRSWPSVDGYHLAQPRDETVAAVYSERLFLSLQDKDIDATALKNALGLNATDAKGLSLDVQWRFDDIFAWLEHPEQILPATAELSYQTVAPTVTVPNSDQHPILTLKGQVRLGGVDGPNCLQRCWRIVLALWRFWKLRGDEITRGSRGLLEGLKSLPGYLRVANVHATHRRMIYTLSNEDRTLTLSGGKELAYCMQCNDAGEDADPLAALNPWNALTRMPFSIQSPRGNYAPRIRPAFKVDLVRLTENVLPLQIERTPNTPTSILATGCLSAYFLRVLLQTHFWSFGAPDYKSFARAADKNIPRLQPPPAAIAYRNSDAKTFQARLAETITHQIDGSQCRLLRYAPSTDSAPPSRSLLLIHGLAHGSRVFWTDTIDTNYVQYFLGQDYDVWLLDYRTSANLNTEVPASVSIDEISRADIPWAVKTVFERINRDYGDEQHGPRKVHVFAHCVGAAAFAAATLQGRVEYRYETDGPLLGSERWRNYRGTMVESATLHAFQPWIKAGVANRWHANALAVFKDNINAEFLDPLPDCDPCFAQILIDRFANSLPNSTKEARNSERPIHAPGNIRGSTTSCNRMNLIYGYEWVHANLSEATHASLDTLLGPAPVTLLRQAMKCVQHGRLTDRDGYSIYMRAENFERWWPFPTLFLHGDCNEVFDCASTALSVANLANIRSQAHTPATSLEEPLTAPNNLEQDCVATNTFAHIQPRYGHMDVLFGTQAHQDICPVINRFIRGDTPAHDPTRSWQRVREKFAEIPDMPTQLATGPIISRPESRNGDRSLRVWANSEEFSNEPPRALQFTPLPMIGTSNNAILSSPLTINWDRTPWTLQARGNENDRVSSTTRVGGVLRSSPVNPGFWLGSLRFEDLNSPLQLTLQYGTQASTNIDACQQFHWHDRQWFKRAFDRSYNNPRHALSFLAGSCLYPGIPSEQRRSDQIFQAMQRQVDAEFGVDHVLLLGDQIYADASAGMFDPRSSQERYRARYRRAFGEPSSEEHSHAQQLLASVPTYFAIDDHEISDDWWGCDCNDAAQMTTLRNARRELMNFQMHYTGVDPESNDSARTRAWYAFSSAGFPFFVFDTRSERQPCDRWCSHSLMSEVQLRGFEQWLKDTAADAPIVFIASGSPLGPIGNDLARFPELADREDTLLGYPGFLAAVCTILAHKHPRRIVWLSGDPHFSTMGEVCMCNGDGAEARVQHICASGLFAPIPFVNARPDSYTWNRPVTLEYRSPQDQSRGLVIETQHRHPVTVQSHFLRIDVNPEVESTDVALNVRAFDETGSELPWPGRAIDWNTAEN